jgi:plastocyanin
MVPRRIRRDLMRRIAIVLATLAVGPVALYACAEESGTVPGPKPLPTSDASPAVDSGADATPGDANGTKDAADAKTPPAIRCSEAELDAPCDLAGGTGGNCVAETEIPIDFNVGAAPAQYTNHCVKVKTGTVIVFRGSFFQHPLEPAGGDTPTPIPRLVPATAGDEPAAGDAGKPETRVTTSAAGTFGFQCVYHPVSMFGAVRVVP